MDRLFLFCAYERRRVSYYSLVDIKDTKLRVRPLLSALSEMTLNIKK